MKRIFCAFSVLLFSTSIYCMQCDPAKTIAATINRRVDAVMPHIISRDGEINTPGYYTLPNNFAGQITITTSNVSLDLNQYRVTGGIVISPALQNIRICNGMVSNDTGTGVVISENCYHIFIDNVYCESCLGTGMSIGANCGRILLSQCYFGLNSTGLYVDHANCVCVSSCFAQRNTSEGFLLNVCSNVRFKECMSRNNVGSANVCGFKSIDGHGNLWENCFADDNQTTSLSNNYYATGFLLTGAEEKSVITNCLISDTQADLARAYGIKVDSYWPIASIGAQVTSLSWSQDYQYLAVGSLGGTYQLRAVKFNASQESLTVTDAYSYLESSNIYAVAWNPCSEFKDYCVIGGDPCEGISLHLLYYDRITETWIYKESESQNIVNAVSWRSTSGEYLMAAGAVTTGNYVLGYKFDSVAETLTALGATANPGAIVNSVAFSPDGNYVAIGGQTAIGNEIRVYSFDAGAETLSAEIPGCTVSHEVEVYSVAWTPDGQYLAIGGASATGDIQVRIYAFDDTVGFETLTEQSGCNMSYGASATVNAVAWSADGQYLLAVGSVVGGTTAMRVYNFLGGGYYYYGYDYSPYLAEVTDCFPLLGPAEAYAAAWAPTVNLFAVGGATISSFGDYEIGVFNGDICYPRNCTIQYNFIEGITGNLNGMGICGENTSNLIANNRAYNNQSATGAQNYSGNMQRVYTSLTGNPGHLDNESI